MMTDMRHRCNALTFPRWSLFSHVTLTVSNPPPTRVSSEYNWSVIETKLCQTEFFMKFRDFRTVIRNKDKSVVPYGLPKADKGKMAVDWLIRSGFKHVN